ncbi:MAG: thioesterase family protein [Actinomycetes bacterium]|jgi:hypothetical protein
MSTPSPQGIEAATTVTPTEVKGRYRAHLHPAWTVGDKPNGGYLIAVMVRSAAHALSDAGQAHEICVAAATTYAGAPSVGEAFVDVTILRSGKSASQVHATVVQDGVASVASTMVFGKMGDEGREYDSLKAPDLPERSSCIRIPSTGSGEFTVGIMDETDLRLDPSCMDWTKGLENGVGVLQGWASFSDGQPVDTLNLHYLLDSLPPATFPLGSVGWVPTLQLTNYIRAVPAPGPVKISQRAQVVEHGYVDEVCEIWDSTGRLVAHATQLALVRFS